MEKRNFLKGASVLLIAAVMILSTFAATANTNEQNADIITNLGAASQNDVTMLSLTCGANFVDRGLIWDNGDPDFVNGLCCQRIGAVPESDVADDFHLTAECTIESVVWESVDDVTYDWQGLDDLIVYEYTDTGPGAELIDLREVENTREYLGEQWGRPWYKYTIDLIGQGDQFTLPAGDYYILLRPYTAGAEGQSFWLTSPAPAGSTSSIYFRSEYFGFPNWVPGIDVFGVDHDVTFKLYGAGGEPAIPDLDCAGTLSWTDVEPGATVTGEFTVENIGDDDSLLNWEIESYPDWGSNWTFDPDGGTDLPKGAPVTVDVEVVAPDEENTEFTGEVKLVNSADPADFCIIDAALVTPMGLSLESQTVSLKTLFNGASPLNRGLIWDNGDPDFVNGLCCQRIGAVPESDVADDFHLTAECTIESVVWESVDDVTYDWQGLDDLIVYEYTDTGPGAELIDLREVENTREYLGEQWGRPWYKYTIDLIGQGDQFTLPAGDYYILLRPYTAGAEGQSFWLTSPAPAGSTSSIYFRSEYFGFPNWVPGIDVFGVDHDVTFKLYGAGGEPAIPDLDCDGTLSWTDVEPGATVTGEFTVENIGDDDSLLNWEIDSYPDWGNWTFDPDGGTGLPKGAPLTVDVEVVAPDEEDTEFTGEVVLVNSDDPDDTCIIEVVLVTPVSQQSLISLFFEKLAERFPFLALVLEVIF